MANFNLQATGNTNIQTNFRYQVIFPTQPQVGMSDNVTAFCTSAQLPKANGETIPWNMPMGMVNNQAGKRKTQPIQLEFVCDTDSIANAHALFDTWGTASYNINTGVNLSKANYAVDGVMIQLLDENGDVLRTFTMLRAQPTDMDFGTVTSEGNELLKVSCTLIYDNYSVA